MRVLPPYVGITDFTSFKQVEAMLKVFKKHLKPGSTRRLHVGVMMSRKTLRGIETKWSKAFPPKDTISSIFGSYETYNCLHYADYDHSKDYWNDLGLAISYGGGGLKAVQLDMVWPDCTDIVRTLMVSRRNPEIVLQVGKNAIEQAGNDPLAVVERLKDYEGWISRVLLDKSMGRGIGMDATDLIPYVRAIKEHIPDLGLGVAGGLGPKSMGLVEPLVREFPDLSIDAQGQLRPSGNALDPIDWKMARGYLVQALALLK